jgi:amino acid transporter
MSQVHFRKNLSLFSLTMTGVTAIVGSGWLLGTQKIAEIAGPAGILSWILGAIVALLVGLFYVEIGSANPSAGGIGYYAHVTHGRFCGFLTSWINWLSVLAVAPIEAQGIVQYISQLSPKMMLLYSVQSHNLTAAGIVASIGFMFFFMFINYWSVKIFTRFNNFFTILKVIVPILTIIALIHIGLHRANFGYTYTEFMPGGLKSILISVVSCGVVMSFNGFQSPMTFSEEIKDPKRMLPIAVIASIMIALVLYVMLQIVFTGAVSPAMLTQGFAHVNLRSPYVDLLMMANLQIMVTIIYAGSVISPTACGAAFLASSSRILYSMADNKHMPVFLSVINPIYKNPRKAVVTSTIIGCLYLFLFRGWYHLVAVISVLHVFSYIAAPIITMANRIKHKEILKSAGQFILPGAKVLAPILLFILSTLLFYAAWPLTGEMLILIVPGLCFYFYYERKNSPDAHFLKSFKGASWLVLYILGISLITFLGDHSDSTRNLISTPVSMVLLAILSGVIYVYGAFFCAEK